jgi:hypothetical protein
VKVRQAQADFSDRQGPDDADDEQESRLRGDGGGAPGRRKARRQNSV